MNPWAEQLNGVRLLWEEISSRSLSREDYGTGGVKQGSDRDKIRLLLLML